MSRVLRVSLMLIAFVALLMPGHRSAHAAPPAPNPLPVSAADPSTGSTQALVTLVHFSDLQCPFCSRASGTLKELRKRYSNRQLRIVFKHMPLPFHKKARPAAEAAVAVHQLRGSADCWKFIDATYKTLRNGDPLDGLAAVGLSKRVVQRAIITGGAAAKVDSDMALAKRVGVRGTPATFINGVFLSGARSTDQFAKAIDEQLAAASKLKRRGMSGAAISRELTRKNFVAAAARKAAAGRGGTVATPTPTADTTTVWRVPLGRSPQAGSRNAPVTLVVFSDFQCPFCKRLDPTIKQLQQDYGRQLRVVFKHNPLPFHKRAEPAAQLSMHAFTTAGPKAFWKAHDLLFERQRTLEDDDLKKIAADLGMNPAMTLRAIKSHRYNKQLQTDAELAEDLNARGTPASYINGRRLSGAQPLDRFKTIIDEELTHAKALRAKGVPASRLYSTMIQGGKMAPPPPRKKIPKATSASPSKGSARAPVTITIFSDFQCPFCRRVLPTLDTVEREFGQQVRFVFRHRPLSFHKDAMLAHQAAAEAFAQGGSPAFWKMHDWLFEHQKDFQIEVIIRAAEGMGLNGKRMRSAIERGIHRAAIERDIQIADDAAIRGTPGFVVNGEFISGAQGAPKFRRAVRRALKPGAPRR